MKLKLNYFALGELLNKDKFMEDLKVINGKVQLDDGSEIDFKPVFAPQIEYGDWVEDTSISIINVTLSKDELDIIKNKEIIYIDLYFIDNQFWFDLKNFYLVIQSNDYIYNHIYHKKFAIILNDNNNKVIQTLNFIKKENIQII